MSSFSFAAITFSPAPTLPSPTTDAAAIRTSNGIVYLIGGNSGNISAEVLSLSPGATSWTKNARLDQERIGMGVGLLAGGNIAIFGGSNKSSRLATAISYNPAQNKNNITPLPSMSAPRSYHGYATDPSGNLYAIGGLTNAGTTATIEVFSPATQTWTLRAPLPEPLSNVAAASDGGNSIYAFGGVTAAGIGTAHAYRYSISLNRWDPIASITIDSLNNFLSSCNSSNAAAMGPDDKIFLICGSRTVAYHIVGDFWNAETLGSTQAHTAVALDGQGRLIAAGGNFGTLLFKPTFISTPVAEPAAIPRFLNQPFFGQILVGAPFRDRYITEGSPHATFSLVTSPVGLTMDSVSGLVNWTPTFSQLGANTLTVRATNAFGSKDLTAVLGVQGPVPPAPSAPIASEIGETSLRLTWGSVISPSGLVTYTVYINPQCSGRQTCSYQPIATTTATTAVIPNLVPGQTRSFYVVAMAGGSQSLRTDLVTATLLQPATPSTLTLTAVTQTSASVAWQATVSPIPVVGYRLYENGIRLQDNLTVLNTTVPGLAPGSLHNFEIRAFDASGFESRGSFLSFITLFPPVISHTNVNVADRVIAVIGEPMTIIAATTPLTSTVGADYVVKAAGLPVPTFSLVSGPVGMTVNPTTGLVSWTPTGGPLGLMNATIRASNSEGVANLTFSIEVFAAGSDLLIPTIVPTYQSLTNVTSTSATFTWFAATDNKGVVGYNIYKQTPPTNCGRGTGCSGGPIVKDGVAGPDASYTITSLTPNTAYAIWFEPFDAAGNVAFEQIGRVLPLLRITTLP